MMRRAVRLLWLLVPLLAPPTWAAITEDTGSPWSSSQTQSTTTTVTVSISTAGTNRMVVAALGCGTSVSAAMFPATISGGGLSWSNGTPGGVLTGTFANQQGSAVWWAPAAAQLTSQTITLTRQAGQGTCVLSVHAYAGALTSGPGALAVFEDSSAGGSSHLVGVSITPDVTGSVVVCSMWDGNSSTALVANAATTLDQKAQDSIDGSAGSAAHLTSTTTGGVAASCAANKNDSFVTAAALEICPASGCSAGGTVTPRRTLLGVGT